MHACYFQTGRFEFVNFQAPASVGGHKFAITSSILKWLDVLFTCRKLSWCLQYILVHGVGVLPRNRHPKNKSWQLCEWSDCVSGVLMCLCSTRSAQCHASRTSLCTPGSTMAAYLHRHWGRGVPVPGRASTSTWHHLPSAGPRGSLPGLGGLERGRRRGGGMEEER